MCLVHGSLYVRFVWEYEGFHPSLDEFRDVVCAVVFVSFDGKEKGCLGALLIQLPAICQQVEDGSPISDASDGARADSV